MLWFFGSWNLFASKHFVNFPRRKGLKTKSLRVTLCLHWAASCMRHNLLETEQVIAYKAAWRNNTGEKSGLATCTNVQSWRSSNVCIAMPPTILCGFAQENADSGPIKIGPKT